MHAANWHPLTWMSHMLDVTLFGVQPGAHHLMNVGLHVLASWLLFGALSRLTSRLWPSAIVAALFAVHPAHVESVAWVAERKDVLSALFWMLTLWAYARYAADTSSVRYLVVLACFGLGLLAKPMLVTLPGILLLLDYWPLGRIVWTDMRSMGAFARRAAYLVGEKSPLLVMAAASSFITVMAQGHGGAFEALEALSLPVRIANAASSVVAYIGMLVWPVGLAAWYPYNLDLSVAWSAACGGLIVLLSALAIAHGRRRGFLPVGWFWFLGALIPVMGIVQIGAQARADRYTYLPSIGLFIVVVWGADALVQRFRLPRRAITVSTLAVIVALGVAARRQTESWRSSESLYRRALSVTTNNYLAHQNLCHELARQRRLDEAYAECKAAVRAAPASVTALNSLSAVVIEQGRYGEALNTLAEAVTRAPDNALLYANRARALLGLGDLEAAVGALQRAEAVGPRGTLRRTLLPQLYTDIAAAYLTRGRRQEAERVLGNALRLDPNHPEARALQKKLSGRLP
jgi:tetratricopeptide (TPR) repeat protein